MSSRLSDSKLNRLLMSILTMSLISVSSAVTAKEIVRRSLNDAFVDSFFLENVEPIVAQMPSNWGDPETNLLAGVRVDNLDTVLAGGQYPTFDDMLLAFYDNQVAFNNDPSRNRIKMHGSIKEIIEGDGTVLAKIRITYRDLPLTVYDLDSWNDAFDDLDLARAITVVENGVMTALFEVDMVLPFSGAPLHYWDAVLAGNIRRQRFSGFGTGWRQNKRGRWVPVRVLILQVERDGEFLREIVRLIPAIGAKFAD